MKKEKEIKLPQYDLLPCWYELFLKDDTTVGIRIHRSVLPELESESWGTAPIISDLIKKYTDLKSFTPPSSGSWGFGDIFTAIESTDPSWVVWEFKLPDIRTEFNYPDLPKTHICIRATLAMFCMVGRYLNTDSITDLSKNQLIIIDHINLPQHDRFNSGSLNAILTPAVLPWIAKQPEGHVKEIQDAMRTAHNFMWDGASRSDRFGARIGPPKWIYLDVPGDACDLGPDNNSNSEPDLGYTLVPHNVDSGVQQLSFIAGLAKIHDLIRADGY